MKKDRIGVICEQCGHVLLAPPKLVGKEYPCPSCCAPISVPHEPSEDAAREIEIHEFLSEHDCECCPDCGATLVPGEIEAIARGGQGGATPELRWHPKDRSASSGFSGGMPMGRANRSLTGSQCGRCRRLFLDY